MREIIFYRTPSGNCPVEDFLDSLSAKQAQKVIWVLKLVTELESIPTKYLKKLVNTDNIWEIRIKLDNNIYRLLGFFQDNNLIILTNGFTKKTQKTPIQEIKLAETRKQDYLQRRKINE
jgi:phage-related protein